MFVNMRCRVHSLHNGQVCKEPAVQIMMANWRLAGIMKGLGHEMSSSDSPTLLIIRSGRTSWKFKAMNSGTPNSNPVSVHDVQKTCDTANAMSVGTPPRRTIGTVERWMGSA